MWPESSGLAPVRDVIAIGKRGSNRAVHITSLRTMPTIGCRCLWQWRIDPQQIVRAAPESNCHPTQSAYSRDSSGSRHPCLLRISDTGCGGGTIGGAVIEGKHPFAAAVRHFIEQRAVAAFHVLWLDEKEVSGIFHASARVSRSLVDVGDDRVGRQRGVNLEVDLADQLFVWAGGAERLPVDQIRAGLDLDACDLGGSWRQESDTNSTARGFATTSSLHASECPDYATAYTNASRTTGRSGSIEVMPVSSFLISTGRRRDAVQSSTTERTGPYLTPLAYGVLL